MTILKKLNKFISVILCLTLCLSCVTVTSADSAVKRTEQAEQADQAEQNDTAAEDEASDTVYSADDTADKTDNTAADESGGTDETTEITSEAVTAETAAEQDETSETDGPDKTTDESETEVTTESAEGNVTGGTVDQVESPAAIDTIANVQMADCQVFVDLDSGDDMKDGKTSVNAVGTLEKGIEIAKNMHDTQSAETVNIWCSGYGKITESGLHINSEQYINVYMCPGAIPNDMKGKLTYANIYYQYYVPDTGAPVDIDLNGLNVCREDASPALGFLLCKTHEANISITNCHFSDFAGVLYTTVGLRNNSGITLQTTVADCTNVPLETSTSVFALNMDRTSPDPVTINNLRIIGNAADMAHMGNLHAICSNVPTDESITENKDLVTNIDMMESSIQSCFKGLHIHYKNGQTVTIRHDTRITECCTAIDTHQKYNEREGWKETPMTLNIDNGPVSADPVAVTSNSIGMELEKTRLHIGHITLAGNKDYDIKSYLPDAEYQKQFPLAPEDMNRVYLGESGDLSDIEKSASDSCPFLAADIGTEYGEINDSVPLIYIDGDWNTIGTGDYTDMDAGIAFPVKLLNTSKLLNDPTAEVMRYPILGVTNGNSLSPEAMENFPLLNNELFNHFVYNDKDNSQGNPNAPCSFPAKKFTFKAADHFSANDWEEYKTKYSAVSDDFSWEDTQAHEYPINSEKDIQELDTKLQAELPGIRAEWEAEHPGYKFGGYALYHFDYPHHLHPTGTDRFLLTDAIQGVLESPEEVYIGSTVGKAQLPYSHKDMHNGSHNLSTNPYIFNTDKQIEAYWIPVPDLSITKQIQQADQLVSANSARPGDTVDYVITVKNTGGVAVNVTVEDILDRNLTYVSADSGGAYTDADRKAKWTIDALRQNESKVLKLSAKINDNVYENT